VTKRNPHQRPDDVPLAFTDAPRGERMTKPRKRTGHYVDLLTPADPAVQPPTEAPAVADELDPIARAAVAERPRRRERGTKRHGRLAEPGVVQVNVALPADLRLRLKRHCEDATIAAQARDPLAAPVTMSAIVERLVRDYLEGVKA
jgi:hypothetical protein